MGIPDVRNAVTSLWRTAEDIDTRKSLDGSSVDSEPGQVTGLGEDRRGP